MKEESQLYQRYIDFITDKMNGAGGVQEGEKKLDALVCPQDYKMSRYKEAVAVRNIILIFFFTPLL